MSEHTIQTEEYSRKQLEQMKELIARELEFDTRIVGNEEGYPITQLVVGLTVDHLDRERFLLISILPTPIEDVPYTDLFSFYTIIPNSGIKISSDNLLLLLQILNSRIMLGHFGFQENNEMYYRYTYTQRRNEDLDQDKFLDIIYLYIIMMNMFSELVEEVTRGNISIEDALQQLDEE